MSKLSCVLQSDSFDRIETTIGRLYARRLQTHLSSLITIGTLQTLRTERFCEEIWRICRKVMKKESLEKVIDSFHVNKGMGKKGYFSRCCASRSLVDRYRFNTILVAERPLHGSQNAHVIGS